MKKYKVWVRLECEYDDIEACNKEDAFIQASDYAIYGGSWEYSVEECNEEDEGKDLR